MSFSSVWTDFGSEQAKEAQRAPLVTVFGAGISGLTVAHELVERGFAVQVVEVEEDPDRDYRCLVGGLAANQLAHVPATPRRLHPYLFSERAGDDELAMEDGSRSVRLWVFDAQDEDLELHVGEHTTTIPTAGLTDFQILVQVSQWLLTLSGVVVSPGGLLGLVVAHVDPRRALRVRIGARAVTGEFEPSQTVRYEELHHLAALRDPARVPTIPEAKPRFPTPQRLQFDRTLTTHWLTWKDDRGVTNLEKMLAIWSTLKAAYGTYATERRNLITALGLDDRMTERMKRREELLVEIRGHTSREGLPAADRTLSTAWATLVRDDLLARNASDGNAIPALAWHLAVAGIGHEEPIGNPRQASGRRADNRVEIGIVEGVLPGEHGYRFFPGFYRHLFDTMKRTPILGPDQSAGIETAYDQLVRTPNVDVAFAQVPGAPPRPTGGSAGRERRDPEAVPPQAPRSFEEMRNALRILLERLQVEERDILQFQYRLFVFLTSSKERRKQYESQSWWEFLGAHQPGRYTERMLELLLEVPQALVGMDAKESDARTQGVIYCQLLLDALTGEPESSRTLNGPSSRAWFDHWKRYLRRQGVRFFTGRLTELKWRGGELLPAVTFSNGSGASISAMVAVPESIDMLANSRRIVVDPVGQMTREQLAAHLANQIGPQNDLSVQAQVEPTDPTIVHVEPAFSRGQFAVTAGTNASGSWTVDLNDWPDPPQISGADATELRDQLALCLADNAGASGLRIDAYGSRSLAILPRDHEAIVSVVGHAAGEYGLRIAGHAVRIDFDGNGGPHAVQEQLLHALVGWIASSEAGRSLDVTRFERTGLLFSGIGPEGIDVSEWPGMQMGPHLELAPFHADPVSGEDEGFTIFPGGIVDLSFASPGIGVLDAEAEVDGDEFVTAPIVANAASSGSGPDFYVLAVPYLEASQLVADAAVATGHPTPPFDGVFAQLLKFDEATGRRDSQHVEIPFGRDGHGRPVPDRYPLRELSGIQYFFENQLRIGTGHSYYVDAPWGLSSISQPAWWRERMSSRAAFLGQVSVDLGDFYRSIGIDLLIPSPIPPFFIIIPHLQPSAWRSTKREIAEWTWGQIRSALDETMRRHVPKPSWFHLDRAIVFDEGSELAFGSPCVLHLRDPANDMIVAVGGVDVTVQGGAADSAGDLVAAVEQGTPHLARALSPAASGDPRVAIAPAARVREARLFVAPAETGRAFRIAVTREIQGNPVTTVASYTSQAGDGIEEIRTGLVADILARLPGVVAEKLPLQDFETMERGIRIYSPQEFEFSALAVAPGANSGHSALLVDPAGVVMVEPKVGIDFESRDRASPLLNRTPLLINTPHEFDELPVWRHRPGINAQAAPGSHSEALDAEIFYEPSVERWLMVGNQMATWTRLTTMESANESARHAVVAILHALVRGEVPQNTFNGQDRLFGSMPEIWDPEESEVDDLDPLKRLDERLMAADGGPLPHFTEILRIDQWIYSLPQELPPVPNDQELEQLMEQAREQLLADWRFTQIDDLERAMSTSLRALIGKSSPTPPEQ